MDEERKPTGACGHGGRYELRVKGHLDARWADWFDGLALTHEADGSTAIRGTVIDQAALHGLLEKLRDLGLALISVTELEPDDATRRPPEPR
ncbi:MAG TPA: hypothetical protein VFP30_03720 [Candidatus Limnocylindria bacterium]|nr:hypothetical protein [Candidatus Limnocylindria bacterium]